MITFGMFQIPSSISGVGTNFASSLRDCSLFMTAGAVFIVGGGGVKFSKQREMGGVFFNTVELRGDKLLESVVSTLLLPFCRYVKLSFVLRTLSGIHDFGSPKS